MKLIVFALVLPLLAGPALAASDCSDQEMTDMKTMIDKMPAGADRDAAMKEYSMAADSLKQQDMKSCKDHMDEAGKRAGKK